MGAASEPPLSLCSTALLAEPNSVLLERTDDPADRVDHSGQGSLSCMWVA